MEYTNVEIRLSGSRDNTVVKEVSAPEVVVLRQIHGHDSLVGPKFSRVADVSIAEERKRLDNTYDPVVVEKLFPGALGTLPTTLAAVGIEDPDSPVLPTKKAK